MPVEETKSTIVPFVLSLLFFTFCYLLRKIIRLQFFFFYLFVYLFFAAVMQSEGFQHLEESCPSLLCEMLKTFASGDENSSLLSGRKRSGSSIYGLDLGADGAAAESVNPNARRVRRRF